MIHQTETVTQLVREFTGNWRAEADHRSMDNRAGIKAARATGLFFVLAGMMATQPVLAAEGMASGRVFLDSNGNGRMDAGERGLEGVGVSNQEQVVLTDAEGRWQLPCTDDTVFFVIKPQGYRTPLNHHNLPQFYYLHKPAGSPDFRFRGVDPTGDLPESIDFPLMESREPREFEAVFFGDPQPRDIREVEYIGHDVIEELIGTDASFGVTLGDIVFDDLSVFEPMNGTVALVGIPWYNVIGNHDINFDAVNDADSDETFTRIYGPNYYSFDYGPVHFLVLDDVMWGGAKPAGTGSYTGGFGEKQIRFIRNDLKYVDPGRLVVLMMHIPIVGAADREEVFRLIEDRPYTLSISGHTHWQAHMLLDEEAGWKGADPHHHFVCVTVSGSWWSGLPDEFGIPHTSMRDGVPNGYAKIRFSENKARFEYKAARRPASFQMSVYSPDSVQYSETGKTPVYANVFNGWERSQVQMRINDSGEWQEMTRTDEKDPFLAATHEREPEAPAAPWRRSSSPISTYHLWKASLPDGLPKGIHRISVRATDVNGEWKRADRIIRIE
jgi:hypothetical protein